MIGRISEPADGSGGRRRFFGQIAAGSAGLFAGMLGAPPDAQAHEERQTLVRSERGRAWGIAHYRVRRSGARQAVTRIVAHLLNAAGERIGELVRTRRFKFEIEHSPYAQSQIKTRQKRYLVSELTQLAWTTETIEIAIDHTDGQFRLRYNGSLVGRAKPSRDRPEIDPAVSALLNVRPELLRIAGSISEDLDELLPEPAEDRPTECFCCNDHVTCAGLTHSCVGYALLKSQICNLGIQCIGIKCWNSFCAGCCEVSCDPECLGDSLLCIAYVSGRSCGCDMLCP